MATIELEYYLNFIHIFTVKSCLEINIKAHIPNQVKCPNFGSQILKNFVNIAKYGSQITNR